MEQEEVSRCIIIMIGMNITLSSTTTIRNTINRTKDNILEGNHLPSTTIIHTIDPEVGKILLLALITNIRLTDIIQKVI